MCEIHSLCQVIVPFDIATSSHNFCVLTRTTSLKSFQATHTDTRCVFRSTIQSNFLSLSSLLSFRHSRNASSSFLFMLPAKILAESQSRCCFSQMSLKSIAGIRLYYSYILFCQCFLLLTAKTRSSMRIFR